MNEAVTDATQFLKLQDLQEKNPGLYVMFCVGVVAAVKRSFVQDALMGGSNFASGDEVRRRTQICARIVRDLHEGTEVGKGYSPERIVDELPKMLRTELESGKAFVPPEQKRTLWAPARANQLIIPGKP